MSIRHTLAAVGLVAAALTATPAFAGEGPALPPIPDGPQAEAGPVAAYSVEERQAWLAECRERVGDNGDRVAGAVIGGVIGGVAGNRIAGRGNRVVGTVVGAGVGAAAGAAIDGAVDRDDAADFCEDYLNRYEASYANTGASYGAYAHGGHHGAAYGGGYYGGRVMWVPIKISGGCGCGCKPKVREVEEWIEEPAPPPARRVIRDKRIKLQPTKTKAVKTKYVK
jgi:hypothetical protein